MGCDIHLYAEKMVDGKPEAIIFKMPDWLVKYYDGETKNLQYKDIGRSYALFGWLADIRNYSDTDPLSEPRGIPDDVSPAIKKEYEEWRDNAHTPSWFSVEELLKFDYDQPTEDCRYTEQLSARVFNGAATAEIGQGVKLTYRDFLGKAWFEFLDVLKEKEAYRIIFWFDN